jgi:3-hydroxyacyl-[acyl-carrier-protein] dehydratase
MSREVKMGLRYCGGCNPRYDRVALVKQLQQSLPGIRFELADAGAEHAAALLVCGCSAQCVGVSDLTLPADKLVYIASAEQLDSVRETLLSLAENAD